MSSSYCVVYEDCDEVLIDRSGQHYLVVAKVRERLTVSKETAHRVHMSSAYCVVYEDCDEVLSLSYKCELE
jgi:hypothetical protein